MVLAAILVVTGLILANALYVAAEFAAVSVRRSRIQQLAADGNVLATWLLPVIESPKSLDGYIAACQIGITLSSLVLGAYAQGTIAVWMTPWFAGIGGLTPVAAQSTSAVVVLLTLTVAQVVFAELVPKSLALQYPTQTSLYTFIPMMGSIWIYRPFIKWLNGTGLLFLRMLGAPPQAHRHLHSPEEIELLIAESRDGGLLEPDEHRRLQRALRLNLRQARQLMVPRTRISALDIDTPLEEAIRMLVQSPYSRLPVYRDSLDNIVGIVHTKDLVRLLVRSDTGSTTLSAVMRPITSIHESITADRVLRHLRERRSHHALVVDEFGGTAGLLTLEDVLSELIGNVGDEFKPGDPVAEPLPNGRIRLPGSMAVDDAAVLLRTMWDTDATTVGGLVTAGLGHLPVPREVVVIGDYEFEVERVADRALQSVIARRVVLEPDGGRRVTEVLVPIAIVLLLVVANGLFVAAEFAIVGAPRASIEHQASQGSRLAQRVERVLSDPKRQDRYIATTQIGISVASLGLGMYGEHALAEWLAPRLTAFEQQRWIAAHSLASIIAIAILTYLHIVIGEMVPKTLALQRAAHTVLYVTPVIQALEFALYPVVVGLNSLGNLLLRLVGVRRREVDTERYHTTEELQFIIQESQEGGMLRGESGNILRELFEFGDLTAREVMVPRVQLVGIPVGASVAQLREIVQSDVHTRYPIFEGDLDHIMGSVHVKWLLRHLVLNRPIEALDARPLPYVPFTTPLDEVIAAMRKERAQMAVVMDEFGGTAGVITFEDLFEEVVGEIVEGRGRTPITRLEGGRLNVRGTVRLEDVGQALGQPLEHADVLTVSGLVLSHLQRPVTVGDVITWNKCRFEVTATSGRGVGEAIVTQLSAADTPSTSS